MMLTFTVGFSRRCLSQLSINFLTRQKMCPTSQVTSLTPVTLNLALMMNVIHEHGCCSLSVPVSLLDTHLHRPVGGS